MQNYAKLIEVLRLHREQRASRQSTHCDNLAVLSPSSIPPRTTDGLSFTAAVQALSPLVPASKEPSLQNGDATFSSQLVPESAAKKRKRAIPASPEISPSKENNKRDLFEDTSSALDTSDEGIEIEDSEDEREKQALWTVFSSRYAELVGSEAKQSSTKTEPSASQEVNTASAAAKSFATTEKPSEETTTGKGGPADPIEIDSS